MSLLGPGDFHRLAERLATLGAPACGLYRGTCFERRVATRLRIRGCSVDEYFVLLEREPDELARLLRALAISVTRFFRNPSAWRRLRELLVARGPSGTPFRAWSAGCASGEEAYSIAMLLASLEGQGAAAVRGWEVLGTDLDASSLTVAARASYPLAALADVPPLLGPTFRRPNAGRFEIDPEIRARVRFERADLTDSSQPASADLVLCRNVLIYFTERGQDRLLDRLIEALRPGGLLMLGKAEMAARFPAVIEPVDSRERIYRRVG